MAAILESIFCLQDIAKPIAVVVASKDEQSQYNGDLARNLLMRTPFSDGAQRLISDVVGQDYLGALLASEKAPENYDIAARGMAAIIDNNQSYTKSADVVWKMLFLAHGPDASACTRQAQFRDSNGRLRYSSKGLDRVFKLNDDINRALLVGNIHEISQVELRGRVQTILRVNKAKE